jgi:hypothetical protein
MTRPRAADDFATTRARMEELSRERAQVPEGDLKSHPPVRRGPSEPWTSREIIAPPGRFRRSGTQRD